MEVLLKHLIMCIDRSFIEISSPAHAVPSEYLYYLPWLGPFNNFFRCEKFESLNVCYVMAMWYGALAQLLH